MKDSIRRVVMSKRVASRFIEDVSSSGRTLTVYFSTDREMSSFVNNVKTSSVGSNISISEGFDHATFLSLEDSAMDYVEKRAEEAGYVWTDI